MAGTLIPLTTVPFNEPDDNPADPSQYVTSELLSANSAFGITVPSFTLDNATVQAAYVRLAGTGDFYVSFTGTAAVPGTSNNNGTDSELIKGNGPAVWRKIPPNTASISVIAGATPTVSASFYRA